MHAMDGSPGTIESVEPLVRRMLAPNPSAFTYSGTQTFIVGTGAVAVIDPGPDLPEHVEALLTALKDETIAAILCTHTHRDHSPAARLLQAATGAPIVGCAALTMDDEGPRADAAFDAEYLPDRVLADGERLEGEGWTLEAVATPGHTSNHLCFALPESGALFSGDHVMGWSTTIVSPPDGDMADYMDSLEKLQARDDRIYYPAHGPAIDRPKRLVRGMIGHRRQREGQILRRLRDGNRFIPEMVATMYKGIDPRLHGAAGRSVLAHLIDLETRGLVARQGEGWSIAA
jgi:glyoxylase-like metal-dependent hydrolase (beta-lactamase superfamily II)